MKYLTTKEISKKWNVSERSIRQYCEDGRLPGVIKKDRCWLIPAEACKPKRKQRKTTKKNALLLRLKTEKNQHIQGGIYHKLQIEFTYNSNHIEGSRLTHDQTRYIFETNTIGLGKTSTNVDDILETVNHFKCIDYVIDRAAYQINEPLIKHLHYMLKNNTSDTRKAWFAAGEYKILPNEVGGMITSSPENVKADIQKLLASYNQKAQHSFKEIIEFHHDFEKIHPFQDGNGRVGRLIALKECLKNNIVPFIIYDDIKEFYYRGLAQWNNEAGYLLETCRHAQDRFKEHLGYFKISYK